MTVIDPTARVADLVVAVPRRARLFEQLRIDYCCGGDRTLEEACLRRDLNPSTVATLIAAFDDRPGEDREAHDVGRASVGDLCDHIVSAHHQPLRGELVRIGELLSTVVRVHGTQRPALLDLQRLFDGLRRELEHHMATEEADLFPACRAAEREGAAVDERLVREHEDEHDDVGETLVALRELSGGYETKLALCGTHRALLEALRELEIDLHQHVHEENNILFPRVRALVAA